MITNPCDTILINDFYMLPTEQVRIDEKPMSIISDFFVQSGTNMSMPFAKWLSDLILVGSQSDPYKTDSDIKYELESSLKDLDKMGVLVYRLFPFSMPFNRSNWKKISHRIYASVLKKKRTSLNKIELFSFEEHEKLFSNNLHNLMRI